MRPTDSEAFLSKNSDKRSQQPVITGEERPAESGENTRSIRIRTKIAKGRSPDGADQNDVATVMPAKLGKDYTRCREAHIGMWPRFNDGRFSEILKGDNENIPTLSGSGGGHLPRQRTTSGKNANATSRCVRATHRPSP
jgi:hypothetical protein